MSLLVAGTASDAGKSVITAALCRWLTRQGMSVAPFKAQNMALNSTVTASGAEIGRAQAMQAAACGIEPEAAMNPVLIKPSGRRRSQVLLMGKPYANATARSYQDLKAELREPVLNALKDLQNRYDVVICEGAGSPAEINLRANDLANMGLARAADLPVLLVGDIDRGGVFPSLFGTLALLEPADQALIAGYVINKFRGDASILAPGLETLFKLTGRPTYAVLPWLDGPFIDAEDSLALRAPAQDGATLDVAVIRLRWMSNFTDLDALASEPGVSVRFTRSAADVERADLVVLPGTKATVEDLQGLREAGLDRALQERDGPTLGICGGYQMLGKTIEDDVESGEGRVDGLRMLPITTRFDTEKLLQRVSGTVWGVAASGYEIRHGRIDRDESLLHYNNVLGTSWHGLLEGDAFRRKLLTWVAERRGRDWTPGTTEFAQVREAHLDRLADWFGEHIDAPALLELIQRGAPERLPVIACSVS
ncbi:cobyric acid synthase [Solirubrobacter ginsenosidimutans]|uniref:Cobyric acid synthase n=1 Tax=Solirubrobacter ginsenosidimutans TaxID=490573 RepID=A0A9X3S0U9_9ACTN|nr:cobyric acid synthase [Solirubrobacter ginsenosidimutans]MDA0162495.1 cobyric acid synthase [Solirubrobacter ginsenosidimutans]